MPATPPRPTLTGFSTLTYAVFSDGSSVQLPAAVRLYECPDGVYRLRAGGPPGHHPVYGARVVPGTPQSVVVRWIEALRSKIEEYRLLEEGKSPHA